MIWLLWLIVAAYALLTLRLWLAWQRIPSPTPSPFASRPSPFTVIIPARNEAANLPHLLADLSQQTYPHFEVIVADDASTDATAQLTLSFAQTATYPLRLLSLTDDPSVASPKKRAIAQSIAVANGTLIVTTDGDCRVGPRWLETIAAFYEQTHAKLISGPVTFTTNRSVFGSLQTVEFASLIGAGAATLAMNTPTMCNGANLCYEKSAFRAVDGFAGVDHIASGDDELLMHKMAAQYPGGVHFLKSREAIVETAPHSSLGAFYRQRKRWAGKWRTYRSWQPTLLAAFIFLSNLAPVLAVAGWAAGHVPGWAALGIVLTKYVPEWPYLRSVLVFLQKRWAIWWIPATQLVYPLYVVFFGLAAQGKSVVWKGRKLK
jgi:cellulose synthase/poly-beta-1,6-N-acetylglucosamine synthase-like glycosyltransferase